MSQRRLSKYPHRLQQQCRIYPHDLEQELRLLMMLMYDKFLLIIRLIFLLDFDYAWLLKDLNKTKRFLSHPFHH